MDITKEQFISGLLKIRDKRKFNGTKFLSLLKAQYYSDKHTITAARLAEAADYANFNAANLHYGTLGHLLADAIGYQPPKRKNGESIWFWTLSTGNDASEHTIDGHYEFVMRPELVAALREMKWVK